MRSALLSAFLLLPMAALAQTEPPRGSELRRDLLGAVRPAAEEFLGPPVEFTVKTLKVSGDVALAQLEIQRPGGRKIPAWSPIDYPYIAALLQRQGGRWVVVHKAVSPNEPYFCEYRDTVFRSVMPQHCAKAAAASMIMQPAIAQDEQWTGPGRAQIKQFVEVKRGITDMPVALYGDFNGDGHEDAVVFLYMPSGGNSMTLEVALFRGENGYYRFIRNAPDVYGEEPRDSVFSNGSVQLTTTMPKPGDARCCPTGSQRYTIRTGDIAPVRVASPPTVTALPSGHYCFARSWSTLRISLRNDGRADFRLEADGGGKHVCFIESDAEPKEGGWRHEENIDGEGLCQLDILLAKDGSISFNDAGWICRRSYCGANASFDNIKFARRHSRPCR